jgi:hypothetical protein
MAVLYSIISTGRVIEIARRKRLQRPPYAYARIML